jgi:hypothetical protein
MDLFVVALWLGAALSIGFVAREYYAYWQDFQRARLAGRIPDNIHWGNGNGRKPGLEWFILNASLVPNGDERRRRALRGLVAFVLFVAAYVAMIGIRGPLTQ